MVHTGKVLGVGLGMQSKHSVRSCQRKIWVMDYSSSVLACIPSTKVGLGQDSRLCQILREGCFQPCTFYSRVVERLTGEWREFPQRTLQTYGVPKLSSAFKTMSKPLNHAKSNRVSLMFP